MEGKTHQNIAKKSHEMLVALAHEDPLTGLLNRRGAIHEFNIVKKNLDRLNQFDNYSLVAMDLIGLKYINDNLGYDKGSKILKDSSYSIKNNIRKTDLAIRLGGDEFMLVLFNVNDDTSKIVIEKINENMPNNAKFCIGYKTFTSNVEFEDSMQKMEEKLDEIKKSRAHDENGRVIGETTVVQLD